jgi:hypothetical protein
MTTRIQRTGTCPLTEYDALCMRRGGKTNSVHSSTRSIEYISELELAETCVEYLRQTEDEMDESTCGVRVHNPRHLQPLARDDLRVLSLSPPAVLALVIPQCQIKIFF